MELQSTLLSLVDISPYQWPSVCAAIWLWFADWLRATGARQTGWYPHRLTEQATTYK